MGKGGGDGRRVLSLQVTQCSLSGSPEERGLIQWKAGAHANSETSASLKSYDFPIGMNMVKRTAFLKYIPICPVFRGFSRSKKQHSVPEDSSENIDPGSVCTKVWNITPKKGRILLIYDFCVRGLKITKLRFHSRLSEILCLVVAPSIEQGASWICEATFTKAPPHLIQVAVISSREIDIFTCGKNWVNRNPWVRNTRHRQNLYSPVC